MATHDTKLMFRDKTFDFFLLAFSKRIKSCFYLNLNLPMCAAKMHVMSTSKMWVTRTPKM